MMLDGPKRTLRPVPGIASISNERRGSMTRFIPAALLLAAASVLPAQTTPVTAPSPVPATTTAAVTAPNLSGAWRLDIAKSDFGQVPPPNSETDIIIENGNDLKVAVANDSDNTGKQTYLLPVTIGGAESATPAGAFSADAVFKVLASKAQWQGATLVVDQKMSYQGSNGTVHSVYTLSADGKMLTRQTHYSLDLGEFDVTYVFDKQ